MKLAAGNSTPRPFNLYHIKTMIHLNCDKLATLTDAEFETLSFRLAILQGIQAPSVTQAARVQAPSERKAPLGDKGPNELEYLQVFNAERMPLKAVGVAKFAELGLVTREDIARACIDAGKRIGEYFLGSVPAQPSGDCEEVETADIDENETLASSVGLDWD